MAARSLVHKFLLRELKKALPSSVSTSSPSTVAVKNPFIPHLNPETGCWAPPRYSLRRQADLIKRARLEGSLHLLPPGTKSKPLEFPATSTPKVARKAKRKEPESSPIADIAKPIEWFGEVKIREPAGANVGNRLYAAKKQMFKGHKWQRVARRQRKYRRILMDDMPKRILKYRMYRVLRRPWPLEKPRITKSRKLPF
ncbi:hypothetical protein K439DRAFT_1654615 [Ramaria rubella]|nr:hypothetical protein K439DRAFT_1654615 [Ramaria rubella]